MIYNLNSNIFIPGKMPEFYEIVTIELLPLYPRLGLKMAGSFHAYTGNMNSGFALYVFDDLASFQKSREAQQKDGDFQKVMAKLNVSLISQTFTLLEPNPWSPMK